MRVNNIDLDAVLEAKRKAEKEGGIRVEKHIEGEFRLDGSPMFVAELRSDLSKFLVTADEPKLLGGQGVHTTPLSYLLFGVMSCYASTLAIQCALDGVKLERLRIKGHVYYDVGPVVAPSDSPIIRKLVLEVEADKDVREQVKKAATRCPALYAIRNPIDVETRQVQ
ncbi:hypothetical protein HS1genome_0658 [Sulfodiicoccus acidiphilus]|uniref:Osmotically inducible protein OsmC n=1 Tax=Sulfodiicoccus acidiphilus TaxID=1670455 RepID=A0A348B267_9CREN|nr:OsmC family protein [Sulfodiicoccus acidiphilus]BBD72269.1 hypothetical protein HS1genome_0658 [Sulfodiicoccus acidiphilus]GGT90654.1 hypothetical protein GCM10007116_05620 [Sulfodiicoccus acidiphilus]